MKWDQAHLSAVTLADYYRGVMNRQQATPIERHLARCDDCTELARTVYPLVAVLPQWSALGFDRAYEAACSASALESVALHAKDDALRNRLRTWAGRLSDVGKKTRRLADLPDHLLGTLTHSLEVLGSAPRVLAPVRTRGAVRKRGSTPQDPTVHVTIDAHEGRAHVAVEDGRASVAVDIINAEPPNTPLLMLRSEKNPVGIVEPTWHGGVLRGRIDGIQPGEYTVELESVER